MKLIEFIGAARGGSYEHLQVWHSSQWAYEVTVRTGWSRESVWCRWPRAPATSACSAP
jgi:hypothetical protein